MTTAAVATAPASLAPAWSRATWVARLRRDEVGALTPAVPIVAIMFLLLAGLVIDSSRELTARARAVSFAEEAARAGASAVDPASDPLVIDRGRATAQVEDYCALVEERDAALHCAPKDVTLQHVVVSASYDLPTGLLGLVGINTLHAQGEGDARPLIGVTARDAQ